MAIQGGNVIIISRGCFGFAACRCIRRSEMGEGASEQALCKRLLHWHELGFLWWCPIWSFNGHCAWHLWHWTGSGGALGPHLSPWSSRLFAWQAWHLATSTFTLRGRRGTWRHRPSLCVAVVALMALDWLWRHTHTQLFHTTLSHTTLSHTTLSHASLSHTIFYTTLSRTTVSHTTLLHTQTYTHTQHCHTQLFHPTCLAPSPFLPAFPISFSHLLVIIGRSWFVGLSGPLIVSTHKNGDDLWMVTMAWGESRVHHTSHDYLNHH